MSNNSNSENELVNVITKLINIIWLMLLIIVGLIIVMIIFIPSPKLRPANSVIIEADKNGNFTEAAKQLAAQPKDTTRYWKAPDESDLAQDINKDLIVYGKEIIVHTSDYFGDNGKVFKSSTNGMNCQNCHLEAGTKIFGNNYSAVASTYPKYRARSGAIENIYKRVNDCFERSLNGNPLDTSSKEMQAIVAYFKWLGKDVAKGEKPIGSGFKELAFLDRAANPQNGEIIYIEKCQSCHQKNGEGQKNADKTTYTYPPLWGANSYNTGAGLFRLSNFAKYVKYNMPLGASHNSPQLTDEEAWDIAAFVNSQTRPKIDISKDWPKINEKPFDHPFGPYTDGFSETQHKLGPFQPIIEKQASLKRNKQKV